MSEPAGTTTAEAPSIQDPAGPPPGEPRVRLGVAVAVVTAAVLLALVVVGTVITLDADRLPSGPARNPPSVPAESSTLDVQGHELRYQELRVTLPAIPFSCSPPADPPPSALQGYVTCEALVHPNYNKAGDDWSAEAGIGLPGDDLVNPTDLRATANTVFSTLTDGFYTKTVHPQVRNRKGGTVSDFAPTDAYLVYGDVFVQAPGLATASDRLFVLVVRLASGQHAFFFSVKPADASKAVTQAAQASFTSLSTHR